MLIHDTLAAGDIDSHADEAPIYDIATLDVIITITA